MRIAFAGGCCSGKSSAAKATGLYNVKFADPLYFINGALAQTKNRAFMQEMSDLAKKHFGRNVFLDIFKNKYTGMNNVAVDDARYSVELEYLIDADWRSVYIMASHPIRKARSDALGLEWLPDHPSESEAMTLLPHCEYVIKNKGSLEELQRKAGRLLEPGLKPGVVE